MTKIKNKQVKIWSKLNKYFNIVGWSSCQNEAWPLKLFSSAFWVRWTFDWTRVKLTSIARHQICFSFSSLQVEQSIFISSVKLTSSDYLKMLSISIFSSFATKSSSFERIELKLIITLVCNTFRPSFDHRNRFDFSFFLRSLTSYRRPNFIGQDKNYTRSRTHAHAHQWNRSSFQLNWKWLDSIVFIVFRAIRKSSVRLAVQCIFLFVSQLNTSSRCRVDSCSDSRNHPRFCIELTPLTTDESRAK